MLFSSVFASAALMGSTYAGVVQKRGFSIPNNDGFPNPSDSQLRDIAFQAGGQLPGGPLPTKLGPGSTTAFQLIAFNELFETAFFNSLLYNVTDGVHGYQTDSKDAVIKVLTAVRAQEELHALGAIATLKSANEFAPSACKYTFPVDNLVDAINLAETFTAVVLGALQDANVIFSKEALPEVVRLVSAVIGQEGEQNGAYRTFLQRIPSESPFLTTVPAAFAWSALQNFVVPGSCPYDLAKIDLPIFPGLMVNGGLAAVIPPADTTLTFTADVHGYSNSEKYIGKTNLYVTYTTGLQIPYSVEIEDAEWNGSVITFKAFFPFEKLVAGGFTHAALTISNDFANADAVVDCAIAGPGVIQVNQSVAPMH